MQNGIILGISNGVWVAEAVGPHAEEVRELFGSATVPTAFTAEAEALEVVHCILGLNPGCWVQVS